MLGRHGGASILTPMTALARVGPPHGREPHDRFGLNVMAEPAPVTTLLTNNCEGNRYAISQFGCGAFERPSADWLCCGAR